MPARAARIQSLVIGIWIGGMFNLFSRETGPGGRSWDVIRWLAAVAAILGCFAFASSYRIRSRKIVRLRSAQDIDLRPICRRDRCDFRRFRNRLVLDVPSRGSCIGLVGDCEIGDDPFGSATPDRHRSLKVQRQRDSGQRQPRRHEKQDGKGDPVKAAEQGRDRGSPQRPNCRLAPDRLGARSSVTEERDRPPGSDCPSNTFLARNVPRSFLFPIWWCPSLTPGVLNRISKWS